MIKYNIGWGLTSACNMNCKFCYSKETRSKISEVGLKEWKNFIDKNYKQIDSINYGTGENTLCNDFFTFILYVREAYPFIKQALTTNGYLYEKVSKNSDLFEIYKKCIDEIDVSLDFAEKAKHNYFRGQPNAYDWAINTLKMMKKDCKKSTIVFVGCEETLTTENIKGLFSIAQEYNSLVRLNIYRPVSESKTINEKFILSYSKIKNILEYINEEYQIVALSDVLFGNMYVEDANIRENTGINSIRILPDGNIYPSTYLITEEYNSNYNINQDNILSKIKFKEFENAPIPKECEKCKLKSVCRGGVYDRRFLWYGTLQKRDPYCPFENGDCLNQKKFKVTDVGRVSVHDGYLPTMFFKNKEKL